MPEYAKYHPKTSSPLSNKATKLHSVSQTAHTVHSFSAEQQPLSNQAMQRMLRSGMVQAKLTVNPPDDEYERVADQVAEKVMSMPEPGASKQVQRASSECEEDVQRQPEKENEEEPIQAKPIAEQIMPFIQRQTVPAEEEPIQERLNNRTQREEMEEEIDTVQNKGPVGGAPRIGLGLEAQIRSLLGGGQPLPLQVRRFFEPRLGYDFSQVKMHTDAQASLTSHELSSRRGTTPLYKYLCMAIVGLKHIDL